MYGSPEITKSSIKCEECGKYYRTLGQHIIFKHKMSALEYKNRWGYCHGQPLECLDTTQARRTATLENGTIQNIKNIDNGHRFQKGQKTWHHRGISAQTMLKLKNLHLYNKNHQTKTP